MSCPVSSPHVRDLALRLAASCGWTLTVDAFASHSHALLPRFFARYAEPSAEVEDAFTVPDWACSTCPTCGLTHRETLFTFLPPPLINVFVTKARADGARAILITPLSVAAPFWNKLLRASVVPNPNGYIRVRKQQPGLGSDVNGELAIFAVDFSPHCIRHRLQPPAPPCCGECAFRGRPPAGSPALPYPRLLDTRQPGPTTLSPPLLTPPHPTTPPPKLLYYTECLRPSAPKSIRTLNGWLPLGPAPPGPTPAESPATQPGNPPLQVSPRLPDSDPDPGPGLV